MPINRRSRSFTINEQEILDQIRSDAAQDIQGRAEWLESHTRRMEKYRMLVNEDFGLFEDSYDVNIPIMMMIVQRMQASLMNAVMSGSPITSARARDKRAGVEGERRVSFAMDSLIRNDMKAEGVIDDYITAGLTAGKGIQKISFEYVVRMEKFVHTFRPIEDTEDDLVVYYQFLEDIYGAPRGKDSWTIKSRSDDGNTFVISRVDRERMYDEAVEDVVNFYPDDHKTEVVVAGERVYKRQPKWEVVSIEDVLVPTNARELKVGKSQHVIHVMQVPVSHLKEHMGSVFNLLTDEKLDQIKVGVGYNAVEQSDVQTTGERQTFDAIEGIDSLYGVSDSADRNVPLFECYYSMDIDDDGRDEEVVVWIVPRGQGHVIGAKYLTEVFPRGDRPFAEWDFIKHPDRYYSVGIPELVEGVSDLIHALETQSLDVLAIGALPLLFYRATAGMRPETIRYQYGQLIPVDNPQTDVHAVTVKADHKGFIDHENMLQQYLDRLVSLSNLQFGGIPEGGSAALRTARSTLAVLGQADVSAERFLRRLFRGLSDAVGQTYSLIRHFMPKEQQYRRFGFVPKGEDPFIVLNKADLDSDYTFDFTVNTLNSNKSVMREISELLLQVLVSPLPIQMGIVGTNNIYNSMEFFLRHHEIEDIDRFISRPQGYESPPQPPEFIIQRLMQGDSEMEPHPLGRLDEELSLLQALMAGGDWPLMSPAARHAVDTYLNKIQPAILAQQTRAQLAQMSAGFQQQMAASQSGGSPAVPAGTEPAGFQQPGTGPTGTSRRSPSSTKPRG